MRRALLVVTLSVAAASGCVTAHQRSAPPETFVVNGMVRVTGDVSDHYPCDLLKPILDLALKYGVDTCKAVPLTFTRSDGRNSETVFDLWVVTGNEIIAAGGDSDVVDFYERVTLGDVGDAACGRFKFERYIIAGRVITVLAQQVVARVCPND